MATYSTTQVARTSTPLVNAALVLALTAMLAVALGLWTQATLDALSRLVVG